MDDPQPSGTDRDREPPAGRQITISSRALFAGRREVIIAHGAERYRLRITGSDKLILMK